MATDKQGLLLMNSRTTDGTDGYKQWTLSGGLAELHVWGTPDGASIVFATKSQDATDITVNNDSGAALTITAAGTYPIRVVKGEEIKATLSNDGAATDMNAAIYTCGV